MSNYKILIEHKENVFDAESKRTKNDIIDLGIKGIKSVKVFQIYEIKGDILLQEIEKISNDLLLDPITQNIIINPDSKDSGVSVEVYYKSGVTDAVADTVKFGIKDMNINKELDVRTGKKYLLKGKLLSQNIKKIAEKILSNTVVQEYKIETGKAL
ncbi:MAG: hypothetical protein A2551_06290 [Elusimicrobia bacterium RIFOXYD2_FULL_34_30]|nr:MAG: hypothetical protein A2551_06290 [Elusimicrobia bacterium RIFOXYD2_FULL_34_30]